MTAALTLMITRAGQARFTAAQLDADINLGIAQVGLTDAPFVSAPTLEALPGEFKRIASISGEQVGDNVIHMTVRDDADIGYAARGFGLFLADGTLFAVYGQAEPLFVKSPRATLLVALDMAFPAGDVRELRFGDTDFLNPPGTTETKGVVRLATAEEAASGTSTNTVVTPADLRRALPIGAVTLWYGAAATVPAGWAICDGREVQRSDGLGPIRTPNMSNRVPVGAGTRQPGDTFGAVRQTTSENGAHTHEVEMSGRTGNAQTGASVTTTKKTDTAGGGTDDTLLSATFNDAQHSHAVTLNGATASAGAHDHTVDVTQPSIALLFIMKV